MSMELEPENKAIESFCFNVHQWSDLMASAVGLVIGTQIIRGSTFAYREDENGLCPLHNDGYHVTAHEAKAMSLVVKGYIHVQMIRETHVDEPKANPKWTEQLRDFADWAEKSEGFFIR